MFPRGKHESVKAFTLTELIIVVSIIAIIAGLAFPKLIAARLAANETAAITSLRALITAQAIVQTQARIDSNSDGTGEDAYFAELAGTAAVRSSAGGAPAPGVHKLTPSALSVAFGNVDSNGLVSRSGYHFQLWLPGAAAGGLVPGIAELPTVGGADPGNMPDAAACAYLWCCYAWPISAGSSANRAFFVNQRGELLQCANNSATPYSGTGMMPGFDEAFVTSGDMSSRCRVGVAGGNDATIWVPVQ
jgi:prepilin-type N-terminal cleavage/methylation domain-containing protein